MGRYDKDHSADTRDRASVMETIDFVKVLVEHEEELDPNRLTKPTG